jgi:poly(3-hydroxybutyrate) depolymerase
MTQLTHLFYVRPLLLTVLALVFGGTFWVEDCHAQSLTAGTGVYQFSGHSPLRTKPISVFYHIPTGGNPAKMPILLAFHGEDRDGNSYRQDWVAAANQHKFMVFALQFDDSFYPGGDGYNFGNMFRDGDAPSASTLQPDSVWTFAAIDPLFRDIKSRTGSVANSYVAFGHSAGAQFLHRFVLYQPNSLMRKAIAANAGWYTVPIASQTYPYGLGLSPMTSIQLTSAFAKPLLVFLGKLDTNPNSPGLRHNSQTDAQGLYRLARGRYFFNQSRAQAQQSTAVFGWSLAEVAGVGHDHTLMAINALPYVLDAFEPSQLSSSIPALRLCWLTDGGIQLSGLQPAETYSIQLFDTYGRLVGQFTGQAPDADAKVIPFVPRTSTLYIAQIKASGHADQCFKLITY